MIHEKLNEKLQEWKAHCLNFYDNKDYENALSNLNFKKTINMSVS